MITNEQIRADYRTLKKAAFALYQAGKIDESLFLILTCARVAYEYNFIDSFTDDDLDNLLESISNTYFPDNVLYNTVSNRVVFYDYFAYNNRGLTQQYLYALIKLNYEILYVVENDRSFQEDNDIFKVIEEYPLGQQLVLSDHLSFQEKSEKILEAIKVFRPSKAFLHLAPWDIVSSLVFCKLKGSLHRYFINLTDHAFWLGKNLIDTSLEFRNLGYQISKVCRNINTTRLQVQPYYPILQPEDRFLGMPEGTNGKIIGVSGGNGYKFLGDNGRFYRWVKFLLKEHSNFCFILIGAGSASKFFLKEIRKDNLGSRFLLVNDRADIFQLLKNCHIYIGSYPFSGALMSQLAVMAGLPIVAFAKPEQSFNHVEDFFLNRSEKIKTFTDEKEFLKTALEMIKNEDIRRKLTVVDENVIISQLDFVNNLRTILDNEEAESMYNSMVHTLEKVENTAAVFFNLFLEVENNFNPKYYESLNSSIPAATFLCVPSELRSRIKRRVREVFWKNFIKTPKHSMAGLLARIKRGMVPYVNQMPLAFRAYKIIRPKRNVTFRNGYPISSILSPNYITNPKYVTIGKNFICWPGLRLDAIDNYLGQRFMPKIIIGDNVSINLDCHIGCINRVEIGNNVLIAGKVFISDHSHGQISEDELGIPPAKRLLFSKGEVIIGNNVWIGEGVTILSGVKIGVNSIIGANAVVTKNIPPNSVVGGIPAKILKDLSIC